MESGSHSRSTFDDLNSILFYQMERLMNSKGEQLKKEIERSREVSTLAKNITTNHANAINLMKLQASEHMALNCEVAVPKMLGGGS